MSDNINKPKHYTGHPSGIECIQITEHMGFNLGNAIKYLWRCDLKQNAIEDLKKAQWYINREISKRESTDTEQKEKSHGNFLEGKKATITPKNYITDSYRLALPADASEAQRPLVPFYRAIVGQKILLKTHNNQWALAEVKPEGMAYIEETDETAPLTEFKAWYALD